MTLALMTGCTLTRVTSHPTEPTTPLPPRRRRDPEAHRAAILVATRAALTENGYARATIRDIAQRAGVTHGLVMRHFGSKEQLMRAALPGPLGLAEVAAGDPATLPERLARSFLARMDADAVSDPLVAILRAAATNERAAGELYVEMRRRSTQTLGAVLEAADLEVRSDLLVATLIGITFERYVVRRGSLAELPSVELEGYLAGIVRHILGPALPG
jgi:AcrR family transcriptional regulator